MKQLRTARIILALLFLGASVAALLLRGNSMLLRSLEHSQIILSALSVTAGASLVWLVVTLFAGRAYCATVCPVGTLSDLFARIGERRSRLGRRRYRYRHPSRISRHIAWIYIACLIIGIVGIPFLVEPWNMMRNAAATVNPAAVATTWQAMGFSVVVGMIGGIAALILVIAVSLVWGRRFCTDWCPVGIILGYASAYSIYHLEVDRDKCMSCGICEEVCRAGCVKTVSRYIDNSRCVRCLECVTRCPSGAIRFQINRNRPATPLMMRKKVNRPS